MQNTTEKVITFQLLPINYKFEAQKVQLVAPSVALQATTPPENLNL